MDYDLVVNDRVIATVDSVEADAAAGEEISGPVSTQGYFVVPGEVDEVDRQPVIVTIQPSEV